MLGEAVSGTTSLLPFQTHQCSQQSSNSTHYVGIPGSLTHVKVSKTPSQMLTFVFALCPELPMKFQNAYLNKNLLVYFPETFLCFNVTKEPTSTNLRHSLEHIPYVWSPRPSQGQCRDQEQPQCSSGHTFLCVQGDWATKAKMRKNRVQGRQFGASELEKQEIKWRPGFRLLSKFPGYIIWGNFLAFIILHVFIHSRRNIGLVWEWCDISKAPIPVTLSDFYLISAWYIGNTMTLKAWSCGYIVDKSFHALWPHTLHPYTEGIETEWLYALLGTFEW